MISSEKEKMVNSFLNKSSSKGEALWKGWVKFIHFNSGFGETTRPHAFYINIDYFKQKITHSDRKLKDKLGWRYIPSRFHFFAILTGENLTILTTRQDDLIKTSDVLNLDLILPLDIKLIHKSTIRDLGNFAEGSCFAVDSVRPAFPDSTKLTPSVNSNDKERWIICLENDKDKNTLFKLIIRLKIGKQKKLEEKIRDKEGDINNVKSMTDAMNAKSVQRFEMGASAKDGYLILLQDWSQCTLKCGGGVQVQQWMCIPPKKGGKPCIGKLIRKRPCNTKPCPGTSFKASLAMNKDKDPDLNIVLTPIIKSLPVSARPQNYIACKINEANVLVEEKSKRRNVNELLKLPGRLVMNPRTISVFTDDAYENALFHFNLKNTLLSGDEKNNCCILIESGIQSFRICGFGNCGTTRNPVFVPFWQNTFSLFKNGCFEEYNSEKAQNSIGILPKKEGDDKDDLLSSMNMSVEEASSKTKYIKKKLVDSFQNNIEKKIITSENTALRAVKKEINIEDMIKSELMKKSKKEADELLNVMKHERRKQQQLEKIFRERESEIALKRQEREAENTVQAIKVEAQKEVETKRLALRHKIQEIKKKMDRRKRLIELQINTIRSQMAKKVLDENKLGDKTKCTSGIGDNKKINRYCDTNIIDNYNKNLECKSPDSFGYICCEIEFGSIYMAEREDCYKHADTIYGEQIKKGEFIWQH
jgi:hypothetical protein